MESIEIPFMAHSQEQTVEKSVPFLIEDKGRYLKIKRKATVSYIYEDEALAMERRTEVDYNNVFNIFKSKIDAIELSYINESESFQISIVYGGGNAATFPVPDEKTGQEYVDRIMSLLP